MIFRLFGAKSRNNELAQISHIDNRLLKKGYINDKKEMEEKQYAPHLAAIYLPPIDRNLDIILFKSRDKTTWILQIRNGEQILMWYSIRVLKNF